MPEHVAIIMDGNGRWAKRRLLPRFSGHKKGLDRMMGLLTHAFDVGVKYVTVYALSTENLSRPKEELEGLFSLIRTKFVSCIRKLCSRGAALKVIGDLSLLPEDVREILRGAEKETEGNQNGAVVVAIAYGGRDEIVRAARKLSENGEAITEASLRGALDTGEIPDPDLLIRTGNETRLSNFLLYEAAYAELYFSEKMFPEFSNADLDRAFREYAKRTRRFGKTDEQLEKENER